MIDVTPLAPGVGALVQAPSGASLDSLAPAEVMELYQRYGAVLLRGFGGELEGFKRLSSLLSEDFSEYRGGGLRFGPLDRQPVQHDRTVLTVTGAGQGFGIPLHGEMQYMPTPPAALWFYCDVPPMKGGQTTIADAAAVERHLSPEAQAFFSANRILYRRTLGPEDWRRTFLTSELDEAERFCEQQGFRWSHQAEGDIMRVEFVTDAIRTNPDGIRVFLNNIQFIQAGEDSFRSGWTRTALGIDVPEWPFVVRTEDGRPIPTKILEDIERAGAPLTHEIAWQKGDVVLIDNRRILHGRRSCSDKNRMILVRLAGALRVPSC